MESFPQPADISLPQMDQVFWEDKIGVRLTRFERRQAVHDRHGIQCLQGAAERWPLCNRWP